MCAAVRAYIQVCGCLRTHRDPVLQLDVRAVRRVDEHARPPHREVRQHGPAERLLDQPRPRGEEELGERLEPAEEPAGCRLIWAHTYT